MELALGLKISIVLLTSLCGLLIGLALYRKDDKWERRREGMVKVAAWAHANGLYHLENLASKLAVADIDGALEEGMGLARMLTDPTTAAGILNTALSNHIKLSSPERRAEIRKMIDAASAPAVAPAPP